MLCNISLSVIYENNSISWWWYRSQAKATIGFIYDNSKSVGDSDKDDDDDNDDDSDSDSDSILSDIGKAYHKHLIW